MSAPVTQAEIHAASELVNYWLQNCGHFGHVSQEQATRAFMDLEAMLHAIAERDAEIAALKSSHDACYQGAQDWMTRALAAEAMVAELKRSPVDSDAHKPEQIPNIILWEFDRYVHGKLMAEGAKVHAETEKQARDKAFSMFDSQDGMTLVLRESNPVPNSGKGETL